MRFRSGAVIGGVLGVLSSLTPQSAWAQSTTADGSSAVPPTEGSGLQTARTRSFGPGTEVEVIAPGSQQVYVYIARAVDRRYRPADHQFARVGKTPIVFELPEGENFWLEVESPQTSRGAILLRMDGTPKHLQVRPGSSDMGDLSSLTLAVGAAAVVAATAILISGTGADGGLDKSKVVVPLYAAGGALVAGGIALYFASSTHVDAAAEQSAGVQRPRSRHGPLADVAFTGGLRLSF